MDDIAGAGADAELLNFVYQNAQMGADTAQQLMGSVYDIDLMRYLDKQRCEYEKVRDSAKKILGEKGFDEKGIGCFDKLKSSLMINMQTLTDKTPSHISEILIEGSGMGVVDAVRSLKRCKNAEPKVKCLAEKLRKIEEDNMQELLEFV